MTWSLRQTGGGSNLKTAWEFLEAVLEAMPYKIHTILTDNGIQFCEQQRNRNTPYSDQCGLI
jgi:hypothetical protein